MIDPLLDVLGDKLDLLVQQNAVVIDPGGGAEVRAIGVSILFYVFHRYIEQFDQLIEQQMDMGDESCPAPFASACLKELMEYGFAREAACRYVAMFYQIRRAYFFISRTWLVTVTA